MIPKIKLFSVSILVYFLISCSNNKQKTKKTDENELAVKNLALKYNADIQWDSAKLAPWTVNYQILFIETKRPMLFKGHIYDIVKKDSNYIVKVLNTNKDMSHNFLAVITFTENDYRKINYLPFPFAGGFIIEVSKIISSNPSIKVDEENDEENNSYTYSHLSDENDQMITTFYGKIIDFYINK